MSRSIYSPQPLIFKRNLYLSITYFDKYREIINKIDIYRRVLELFIFNNRSSRLEKSSIDLEKVFTK